MSHVSDLISEDINNLSHALMLREGRDDVMLPALARLTGPLQVGQPSQVRDLAQIRSSQV